MGASLLAIAVGQLASMLDVSPLSRAGSLPQGLAVNPLPNYQKRCWVRRLHQLSNTRSTEPLAAMPMRSCRLLRSA
ncbi:hypothetical protein C0J56_11260 [Pseudomonas fluorescens]|nr:hypothetical protein C0J56_11260 [Pseudomonas fluorescens]